MQVNFYLKKAIASTGKSLIYLRFCYNSQKLLFSFNQSVEPIHWNKKKQRIKSNSYTTTDGKHYVNDLLENLSSICLSTYNREIKNGIPTTSTIKAFLQEFLNQNIEEENKKSNIPSFFELADKFIAGLIKFRGRDKSTSTLKGYQTAKASLLLFEQKVKFIVNYETIDLNFFYAYISFLQANGIAHNTIAKRIRTVKVWMNEALELGYTKNTKWKSRKFGVPEVEVESVYLTESEILQLHNYKPESKKLDAVLDTFLVGCCTGMRYSDYSNLKPENIVNIDGEMYFKVITKKTGNTVIIPCNPIILELFKKYECNENKLPKSISGQKFNDYIKDVLRDAGFTETGRLLSDPKKELWECITSHTARRTAITNWYNQQFPMILLMQISGHKSTSSFIKYVKTSKLQSAQKLGAHIKNNWPKSLLKAV